MPTWIYHITHVRNLESIIRHGALCCDQLIAARNLNPIEIGYRDLKDRRSEWPVPKGPGGMLSDYVPFYFAPRSPMLFVISKGGVPGYNEGQRSVLHLIASAEQIVARGLPSVFTDGHAYMTFTSFFDDLADLNRIDWPLMKARIWRDTPDDGDRARRRQAEFLIHQECPWSLVRGIGVYDQTTAELVQQIVGAAEHQPRVVVCPSWYY
jgi:hypothetical protein